MPSDNPQEQRITVVPLNVEVGYRSAGARRKSYLFPTTKVSQVLVDYALNKFKEQDGCFNEWKFNVTKQECKKCPNPLQCKRTRQRFSLIGTMDNGVSMLGNKA